MNEKLEAIVAAAKNYDGDTVYDGDQGYRLTNIDTPEMTSVNGENSRQAFIELVRDGGQLTPTGEFDKYGRELTDFVDSDGESLTRVMAQGGIAGPTSFGDESHQFAPLAGNLREALGMSRTENDIVNKYAERRQMDPNLVRNIIANRRGFTDNRGTFDKSIDRGQAELRMSVGGAINYLGDRLDSDIMREYGRDMFVRAEMDASIAEREIGSFSEIDSLSDAMTYGMETVGEALPGFAVDAGMAAATGGASLAATAVRRGSMKALAKAGAYGAGLSAGVQSGGAMEAQLEMQGSEDNPFAPIFQGGVSAGMTALPVGAVLDRVLGQFGDTAVKRKLGESVISAFKTAGVAGMVEAPTSAVESFSNQVIESIALGKDTDVDYQLMVDDMIRGAFGGTVMGGGMDALASGVDTAYAVAAERANRDANGDEVDDKNNLVNPDGSFVPVPESDDPVKGRKAKNYTPAERSVSGGAFASEASHDLPNLDSDSFSHVNYVLTGSRDETQMGAELRPPSMVQQFIDDPNIILDEDQIIHFLADFRQDGKFALDSQYNYRTEFEILSKEVAKDVLDKLADDNDSKQLIEVRELLGKMKKAIEASENDQDETTAAYKELASEFKAKAESILGEKPMNEDRVNRAKDYNWRQAYNDAYIKQENKRRAEGKFRQTVVKNKDGTVKINKDGSRVTREPFLQKRARERAEREAAKPSPSQPTSAREELNVFTESLKQNEGVKQAVEKVKNKQPLTGPERGMLAQIQQHIEKLERAAEAEAKTAEAMAEEHNGDSDEEVGLTDIESIRAYIGQLRKRGGKGSYSELYNALDMYEAAQRIQRKARDANNQAEQVVSEDISMLSEADQSTARLKRDDALAAAEKADALLSRLMDTWGADSPEMLEDKLLGYIEHVAQQSDVDIENAVTAVSGEAMARDVFGEQTSDEDAAINADFQDTEEAIQAQDVEAHEADPDNAYDTRVASDFNSLEMLEGLGLEVTPELRDRVAEPDKAEAKEGAVKNADIQASIGDTFYTSDKETAQREQRSLTVMGQAEGPNRTTTGGKTVSTPKKIRFVSPSLIDTLNTKLNDGDIQGVVNLLRKNGLIKQPGTERQSRVARIIRKSRSNLHKYQSAREEINEASQKRTDAANKKRAEDAKKKGETSEDKEAWQDTRIDAGVDMTVPVEQDDGTVSMEKLELDGWEITKLGAQAEAIDIENTRWDGDSPDDYLEQLERAFLAGLQIIIGEGVNYGGVDYFGSADISSIRESAAVGRIEGMDVTTWGDIQRRKYAHSRSTLQTNKTKYRIIPAKGKSNPKNAKGETKDESALKQMFYGAWNEAISGKGKTRKPYNLHPDDWKAIKELAYKAESVLKTNGVVLFEDADAAYDALVNGAVDLDPREFLPDQYMPDLIDPEANTQGELYQGADSSLIGEAEVQEAEGFAADKRTRLTKPLGKQEKKTPKQATERKDGTASSKGEADTKQSLDAKVKEAERELKAAEANLEAVRESDEVKADRAAKEKARRENVDSELAANYKANKAAEKSPAPKGIEHPIKLTTETKRPLKPSVVVRKLKEVIDKTTNPKTQKSLREDSLAVTKMARDRETFHEKVVEYFGKKYPRQNKRSSVDGYGRHVFIDEVGNQGTTPRANPSDKSTAWRKRYLKRDPRPADDLKAESKGETAFNDRVDNMVIDAETKVKDARKKLADTLRAKQAFEKKQAIREDGSHRPVDAERTEADPELGEGDNLSQSERIRRERAIVKATNRKGQARKALFRFLHTLNSRINRIHPEMGEAVGKFLREKEERVNRAVTKLNTIFPDKRRGPQQLQKGYRDLQNGKDSVEAKKLQKFVDEIEAELKELDPSYEPTGKVPTVIDFAKVANNQASFMAILREAGVENPEQFAEDILETRGLAEMHYSPTGDPTKRSNDELLPAIDKLREAGFVIEDAPTIMTRYSFAAMTRGSWAEANGGYDENGKFRPNGQMTQWIKEVHPANREELNSLLLGATGRLNLHHSRFIRALNSVGMAFQTMTVLLFSGIASIPELGVMYSRARELNGLGADVRKLLSKQGRKDMYQFAADYGIAVDQTIKHTLSSLYSMDELTYGRWNEKVADTMFALNGQAKLTHMNRVLAAEIGKRMLADHARKARGGNRRSQRMLAELGIEAETVHHHLMNPDPNTPQGKEFGRAIGRFVNDSVTNPHAGQLPLIASDPRFILLTSLKKFFYGFYNNVHKSLFNEYKNRKAEGSTSIDALRPAIMTAALMLPLAAFAEMIRELVKDPMNNKSQDWAEWARKSALATGGLGPFQAAQSAYDATGYGRNFLVGLAGPTADFILHDVVTGDFMTKRPSRLMPGINQLPWARKPVNAAWKGTYEDIFMDGEY